MMGRVFVRTEKLGFLVWKYEVVYITTLETEAVMYENTAYSDRSARRRGEKKAASFR